MKYDITKRLKVKFFSDIRFVFNIRTGISKKEFVNWKRNARWKRKQFKLKPLHKRNILKFKSFVSETKCVTEIVKEFFYFSEIKTKILEQH